MVFCVVLSRVLGAWFFCFFVVLACRVFWLCYTVIIKFKERNNKMNIIGFDVHSGREIPANLVAVIGDDGWTSLIFADDITGWGAWQQTGDYSWYFDPCVGDDYDLFHDVDAERVTGICGAVCGLDWEASANEYLADYGLKLGRFDAVKGGRYDLVELGGECRIS